MSNKNRIKNSLIEMAFRAKTNGFDGEFTGYLVGALAVALDELGKRDPEEAAACIRVLRNCYSNHVEPVNNPPIQ